MRMRMENEFRGIVIKEGGILIKISSLEQKL